MLVYQVTIIGEENILKRVIHVVVNRVLSGIIGARVATRRASSGSRC